MGRHLFSGVIRSSILLISGVFGVCRAQPPSWPAEVTAESSPIGLANPGNSAVSGSSAEFYQSSPLSAPAATVATATTPLASSTPANQAAASGPTLGTPGTSPPPMFPAGPSLAAAGDMIGFSRELAGGTQAITLISTSRRWMAVYHIDSAGQIRLISSRPLDDDFSIQLNATAPFPEEIRRLKAQ